jgi:oxygen-independent coproporphyrinogen-3 oxidase
VFDLGTGPVSLYLHVPLCKSRCSYCGFYSEPKKIWQGREKAYLDRLLQEISSITAPEGGFHTVYIGGGDPANLKAEGLKTLLHEIHRAGKPIETTIEANPESIDENLFLLFEEGLVSRLSMGIQSMDDTILSRLGRSATTSQNRRALRTAQEARERWNIDISVDLMVALPGQTAQMATDDIDQICSIVDVEHISLYCLTVEEGTLLAQEVAEQKTTVWDEDGQEQFLRTMWEALAKRGFEHYEVSNFAKGRQYSKHNCVYWRLDDYLGLGSSAASTVGNTHWEQTHDFDRWIEEPPLSGYEREDTSAIERLEEYLMMGLRTRWGIDKALFAERFGTSFDELFANIIAHFNPDWYVDTKYFFSLTEDGWMVLDEILLRFVLQIPESLDPT